METLEKEPSLGWHELPYDGKSIMHYKAFNGAGIKINGIRQITMTSKVC